MHFTHHKENMIIDSIKINKIRILKTNPLTREGKISRCAICDSKLHWANIANTDAFKMQI